MTSTLKYRYGNIYREVLKMRRVDVCMYSNQTDILTKQIVSFIKSIMAEDFKPCPQTVRSFVAKKNFD